MSPDLPDLRHAMACIGRRPAQSLVAAFKPTRFDDSDDFLLSIRPFTFDIYLVDMAQAGMGALELMGLIRRKCDAGIIAMSEQMAVDLAPALRSGADMVLAADASREHLSAAVSAVRRRLKAMQAASEEPVWVLFENRAVLESPGGARMSLSDTDLTIMKCFAAHPRVERSALIEALWGAGASGMDNALHATMYRLRKRIEQGSEAMAPVQAVSKVGYEFKAALTRK